MRTFFQPRLLTAAALIPLVVLAVVYLETAVFGVLLGGIVCLASWEWSRLAGVEGFAGRIAYLVFVIACLLGCYHYRAGPVAFILIFSAAIWWVFVLGGVILEQCYEKNVFTSSRLKIIIGLLVLLPPWLSLILLHESGTFSVYLVLLLFVLIWTADSSAYFVGKRWGRAKLADKISPGKTWAGVAGALAGAGTIVLLCASVVSMQLFEFSIFLILCLVTILASILGDLLESMIKRSVNQKDSGALLPGHGGVLDRIDSLTAAAPIFFIGTWLMEQVL